MRLEPEQRRSATPTFRDYLQPRSLRHDDLGSNTIVCSPPDVVPLRFGEDSFYPHLDAARDRGIDPLIIRLPGIGMDIDHPVDLVTFLRLSPPVPTRTLAFLEQSGIAGRILTADQDRR